MAPAIPAAGMSTATKKVLYCMRGHGHQIVFCTAGGNIEPGPGDKMVLLPHTAHAATAGAEGVRCIEAPRQRD
jgi:D-lyxose ketol-isomerase